jgi:outer membrane murein-binding lipoprotein Lpp
VTAALKLDMSARAFAAALLATAVVAGGGGWLLLISPKHHKAATLQTDIQSAQQKLADARKALAEAKKAQQPALATALPSQLAMPQILDQLNAIANRADVTVNSVTPSTAVAGVGYYAVPITLIVDGHFFAVEKFLQLVRNQVSLKQDKFHASGRLLDVAGVQLSSTTAPTVTATLQMRAFYFSPTAAPPAPTTSTTDTTTTP